jgi:hypothetical protein
MKTQTNKRLLDAFTARLTKELEGQFEESGKLAEKIRESLKIVRF